MKRKLTMPPYREYQLYPFGTGQLVVGTSLLKGQDLGVVELRGTPDGMNLNSGTPPDVAWAATEEKPEGPRVMLSFDGSQSARDFAQQLMEMADAMDVKKGVES